MINVVSESHERVSALREASKYTTGSVRSVSAAMFKAMEDKSIDHVFTLCEQLLEEREWALGVIAYDWEYCYALEKLGKEMRENLMKD